VATNSPTINDTPMFRIIFSLPTSSKVRALYVCTQAYWLSLFPSMRSMKKFKTQPTSQQMQLSAVTMTTPWSLSPIFCASLAVLISITSIERIGRNFHGCLMNYLNGSIPFWNSRSQPPERGIAAMQQTFDDLACTATKAGPCCNATSLGERSPDRTSPNFGKHHEDNVMNSFELAGEAMLQSAEGNRMIGEAIVKSLRSLGARIGRFAVSILGSAPGPRLLP
jgi:hypothetical protein